MKTSIKSRWVIFGACLVISLCAGSVTYGANVNLTAYVSFALYESDGVTELPDGSIVMIFGSWDDVNDGPQEWLGGPDLIADSTQGDDIFLGWVRIGEPSYFGQDGTFYTANQITFDDTLVNFLYLRFFETTDYPVGGENIVWGTSVMVGVTGAFGSATIDFVGNYVANMTNTFVIIPEPSTAHLMLLFMGLVAGMRASFRKNKNTQNMEKSGPDGPVEKIGQQSCLMK